MTGSETVPSKGVDSTTLTMIKLDDIILTNESKFRRKKKLGPADRPISLDNSLPDYDFITLSN